MRKLSYLAVTLIVSLTVGLFGCEKQEANHINLDDYETFGTKHNEYLSIMLNKTEDKTDVDMQEVYQNLIESIATDSNLSLSSFLSYSEIMVNVELYMDTTESISKVVNESKVSESAEQSYQLKELENLLLSALPTEELKSELQLYNQKVADNTKLSFSEKEALLISSSTAEYSMELWSEHFADSEVKFPWGLVIADAAGAGAGAGWLADLGPKGIAASAAFFSFFYAINYLK